MTVTLYCRRVTRALRKLRNRYIAWPDDARRRVISDTIHQRSGFPNCLGSGDGSLIRMTDSPFFHGNLYRCRKKFVAVSFPPSEIPKEPHRLSKVNIQATVDHEGRFSSFDLGWPGSVADVTIFKNSFLWAHRRDHFRNGQYILVDKG